MLEQLRPQLLRDPAHLVDAPPCRLLRLPEELASFRRDLAGDLVEEEQYAREALADLVVQLRCDPFPFRLLRSEGPAAALTALGLEPVEHVVERLDEIDDLRRSARGEPAPRAKE